MSKKYIKKISNYAIVGGMGALVIASLSACSDAPQDESKTGSNTISDAANKEGAFVIIEEKPAKTYKIIDEYPAEKTTIILRDENGTDKILSQVEIDKLVKETEAKIDNNTSNLTKPASEVSSGGMSLGETLLASAAGAMIGAYIGNKLFNNQNYNQNRQMNYRSPQTYSRSVSSFPSNNRNSAFGNSNNKGFSSTPSNTNNQKSGFFGGSKSSPSSSAGSSSSSFGG
ncbi:MAG: hypothetical protein FNT15_03610 [Sulfurovum sp.]|nr:MAG: hypothetical protein FNT15_03610 [Sulfurovum sp.]